MAAKQRQSRRRRLILPLLAADAKEGTILEVTITTTKEENVESENQKIWGDAPL